jgi:hypothetical protein
LAEHAGNSIQHCEDRDVQRHSERCVRNLPKLQTLCRGTLRFEAILDGTIADGHSQVRFPAALFAVENQRLPFGDEIWAQIGSEQAALWVKENVEAVARTGVGAGRAVGASCQGFMAESVW